MQFVLASIKTQCLLNRIPIIDITESVADKGRAFRSRDESGGLSDDSLPRLCLSRRARTVPQPASASSGPACASPRPMVPASQYLSDSLPLSFLHLTQQPIHPTNCIGSLEDSLHLQTYVHHCSPLACRKLPWCGNTHILGAACRADDGTHHYRNPTIR